MPSLAVTPGRVELMTTSLTAARRWNAATPSGTARLSARLRMPRLNTKPETRNGSPPSGSTLMTSAPSSDSRLPAYGRPRTCPCRAPGSRVSGPSLSGGSPSGAGLGRPGRHGAVVLAEGGRRAVDPARRAGQVDRHARHDHLAALGVVDLGPHADAADLVVVQPVLPVVERAVRDAEAGHDLQPLVPVLGQEGAGGLLVRPQDVVRPDQVLRPGRPSAPRPASRTGRGRRAAAVSNLAPSAPGGEPLAVPGDEPGVGGVPAARADAGRRVRQGRVDAVGADVGLHDRLRAGDADQLAEAGTLALEERGHRADGRPRRRATCSRKRATDSTGPPSYEDWRQATPTSGRQQAVRLRAAVPGGVPGVGRASPPAPAGGGRAAAASGPGRRRPACPGRRPGTRRPRRPAPPASAGGLGRPGRRRRSSCRGSRLRSPGSDRAGSPAGGSTLMTSAPKSARNMPDDRAGHAGLRSTT